MTNLMRGAKCSPGGWIKRSKNKAAFVIGRNKESNNKVMKNALQYSYPGLVSQLTQAISGVETYSVALSLGLVEAPDMTATLAALGAGDISSKQAKTELVNRQKAFATLFDNTRAYIYGSRDLLKLRLGKSYSPLWDEAGFIGSLEVPRTVEKLLPMLSALAAYFTAHPTYENVPLNLTAAAATLNYNSLVTGRNGVNSQTITWQLAMATRDTKADEARSHVRALLKELSIRMDPLDDRWTQFGFNKPGQLETPLAPNKVSASLLGAGSALVKWNRPARAASYRIWRRIVGVDNDFLLVGSTTVLGFTLESLPAGATIEIMISAINNGGESPRSAKVTVVTV